MVSINTAGGGEAYIGGTVDANGTWSHLADCHYVGKLLRSEPSVGSDDLSLYQRQHGIAASETKEADLEECPE